MIRTSVGICLGASNIKLVELTDDGGEIRVTRRLIRNHESNPRDVFRGLVRDLGIDQVRLGALTGRKFRDIVRAASITEPEAIEQGLRLTRLLHPDTPGHPALVSLGAESFIAYRLSREGTVSTIETGNKCASGTGEFFRQQISRMDIDTEQAIHLATD